MRKKSVLSFFILLIIFSGCSPIQNKGYTIQEASSKNWKFTGGEFLFKGGKEEIKYSIDYIGKDEFQPFDLTFDFSICPKDGDTKADISNAEHLHSNINGYLNEKVNNKYSKKSSYKGKLLDSKKEYNFDNLFLKVSYKLDGQTYEEIIKLPTKEM